MRPRVFRKGPLAAVVACCVTAGCGAQVRPATSGTTHAHDAQSLPTISRSPGSRDEAADVDAVTSAEMRHRLELGRAAERKRRMLEDSKRLLELAHQVHADASESATWKPADQKRLDDIAKLAKSIRERMKD